MVDYTEILGIDVGTKRIGLARVSAVARLPEPICTVINNEQAITEIKKVAIEFASDLLVVGMPRNLLAQDTDQTRYSKDFADKLKTLGIKVVLQDEALSSVGAEKLMARGVHKKNARGDPAGLDEIAACIILNDYIGESNYNV